MNTIARKINQFNKIFNKEEKLVIVLGSIVTLLTIILGFIGIMMLLKWYADFTAPYVIDALNKIVGALFEGWTLM